MTPEQIASVERALHFLLTQPGADAQYAATPSVIAAGQTVTVVVRAFVPDTAHAGDVLALNPPRLVLGPLDRKDTRQ